MHSVILDIVSTPIPTSMVHTFFLHCLKSGVTTEQAHVIEFTVHDRLCDACGRAQADPDQWSTIALGARLALRRGTWRPHSAPARGARVARVRLSAVALAARRRSRAHLLRGRGRVRG